MYEIEKSQEIEISENNFSKISKQDEKPPVEIPLAALSEDSLLGVIDNFINREGTDYGVAEVSHESKVKQLRKQLEKNEIKIVFDPNTETVSLMTKQDFKKFQIFES